MLVKTLPSPFLCSKSNFDISTPYEGIIKITFFLSGYL